MFSVLTPEEKKAFLTQNHDSFIPGYTGHCPTLKFHYGQGYGTKTKEILKELRSKKIFKEIKTEKYRSQDYKSPLLAPIEKSKGQFNDFNDNFKYKAPRYITGYTGFIPTLNFRYGKSYCKAADDCSHEYETNKHRRIQLAREEIDKMFRNQSAPKVLKSIRSEDQVKRDLNEYFEKQKFQEHKISPEYPPIAGYTGHIPRVKGNEESLSQRYNTVVKRGLTLLQKERERMQSLKNAQNQVVGVLQDFENLHKTINVEVS